MSFAWFCQNWKICVFVFVQDSIQVHLKADRGPIMVMTCGVGAGQQSSCFMALEESGIKLAPLPTGGEAVFPKPHEQEKESI